jgi:hypothetical protein
MNEQLINFILVYILASYLALITLLSVKLSDDEATLTYKDWVLLALSPISLPILIYVIMRK